MGATAMPFNAYTAIDAVNGSTLFIARRSWLHYRDALAAGARTSAAMVLGTAAHTSILEPDEFPRRYVVVTAAELADWAPPRNTNAGKATWAQYREKHPDAPAKVGSDEYQRLIVAEVLGGKVALAEADYKRCVAMRNAVRAHPIAGPMLVEGVAEQVIEWVEHVPHGLGTVAVRCKGRLDWRRAARVFVDLKTTRASTLHQFQSQQWALSTFHKMAFYRRGIATIERCERAAVTAQLIAVESTRPHQVMAGDVSPETLDGCDIEIDRLLRELVECRESGRWPGAYDRKPEMFTAPSYAFGGAGEVEFMDTDPADDVPLELEE